MRVLFLLFFVFLFVGEGVGQNLVPNGSFEDYSQCPDAENQVPYATGWKSFLLTPDYFNICATAPVVSIPSNFNNSYQPPLLGNSAYTGFFAYWDSIFAGLANIREHIGKQLNTPLIVGQKYYVSFKVSPSISPLGLPNCVVNNLGVKFSTNSYEHYAIDSITSPLVNNFAHIYEPNIISDTVNWTTIKGSFIADSTYNYIVIGNFFQDNQTDTSIFQLFSLDTSYWCYAYYYLDEVCVSMDSLTCGFAINGIKQIEENTLQQAINIYSIDNQLFIQTKEIPTTSIEIYTLLGELLEHKTVLPFSNYILNFSEKPNGVYIAKVKSSETTFTQKFFLTKS